MRSSCGGARRAPQMGQGPDAGAELAEHRGGGAVARRAMSAPSQRLAGVVRVSLGEGFVRFVAGVAAAFRREHPRRSSSSWPSSASPIYPKREADIALRTVEIDVRYDRLAQARRPPLRALCSRGVPAPLTQRARLAQNFADHDFVIYEGFLARRPGDPMAPRPWRGAFSLPRKQHRRRARRLRRRPGDRRLADSHGRLGARAPTHSPRRRAAEQANLPRDAPRHARGPARAGVRRGHGEGGHADPGREQVARVKAPETCLLRLFRLALLRRAPSRLPSALACSARAGRGIAEWPPRFQDLPRVAGVGVDSGCRRQTGRGMGVIHRPTGIWAGT